MKIRLIPATLDEENLAWEVAFHLATLLRGVTISVARPPKPHRRSRSLES